MSDEGCHARLEIVNKLGLHARAAVLLVQASARFDAQVTVAKDGQEVDGRSIMGVMMLAAEQGSYIDVSTSGLSPRAFTLRALDELHVAVAPGEVFGPGGDGFVRVSFAVEADVLAEGMARIAQAIETFAA